MIGYHAKVGQLLTGIVRMGGIVETDADGIRVIGLPAPSGAYSNDYRIGTGGFVIRRETDEFGRTLKMDRWNESGEWEAVPVDEWHEAY